MNEPNNEVELVTGDEAWTTPEVETSQPSEVWAVLSSSSGCSDPPNDQD